MSLCVRCPTFLLLLIGVRFMFVLRYGEGLVTLWCQLMSETEWTAIPAVDGRVTAAKLGEGPALAVIRWGDRYRVIRVGYESGLVFRLRPGLPSRVRSVCHVFGVCNEFLLAERVCPGLVVVLLCGREFECETWCLRGERTIPPNGPRACETPDLCGAAGLSSVWRTFPRSAIRSLRRRAKRVRILMCRRHDGSYAYRAIYWHSPRVGDRVRVQGLLGVGELRSCEGEMCGVLMCGVVLRVHRTCLVRV